MIIDVHLLVYHVSTKHFFTFLTALDIEILAHSLCKTRILFEGGQGRQEEK